MMAKHLRIVALVGVAALAVGALLGAPQSAAAQDDGDAAKPAQPPPPAYKTRRALTPAEKQKAKRLIERLRGQYTNDRLSPRLELVAMGLPVVRLLVEALGRETDAGIRAHVALAIGEIGDRSASKPVFNLLTSDTDRRKLDERIVELRIAGRHAEADALKARLTENRNFVHALAIKALGLLREDRPQVVAKIVTYVTDKSITLQSYAANALRAMDAREAVFSLIDRLVQARKEAAIEDEAKRDKKKLLDEITKRRIVDGLEGITHQFFRSDLNKWVAWWRKVGPGKNPLRIARPRRRLWKAPWIKPAPKPEE